MAALTSSLAEHGLFLSRHSDLEDDLVRGPLFSTLSNYYNEDSPEKTRDDMRERKAETMYAFISSSPDLRCLRDDRIATPLDYIVKLAESRKS